MSTLVLEVEPAVMEVKVTVIEMEPDTTRTGDAILDELKVNRRVFSFSSEFNDEGTQGVLAVAHALRTSASFRTTSQDQLWR